MQPRILYPARLAFRMIGEIKGFQNWQGLKEYVTTKQAGTTRNIKGGSIKEERTQE